MTIAHPSKFGYMLLDRLQISPIPPSGYDYWESPSGRIYRFDAKEHALVKMVCGVHLTGGKLIGRGGRYALLPNMPGMRFNWQAPRSGALKHDSR